MQGPQSCNALTIDVEEWYQTVYFNKSGYDRKTATDLPQNVQEILWLLREKNLKATFFIVGLVAEKYPWLVKEIHQQGHEIGSHGYSHRLVFDLGPALFEQETRKSKDILEGIIQDKVIGYRASTWSITRRMPWAIDVLGSLGFKYDSSMYPAFVDGGHGQGRFPFEIRKAFVEFPPSTWRVGVLNVPFCGGLFMRFFPEGWLDRGISGINEMGFPALVYFHSWEFSDGSLLSGIPLWKRVAQYENVASMKRKLGVLFKGHEFCSIKTLLGL
ncbi:MAG: polysaccharide deacetylase family protein [Candidatus Omnitrophota bacterium]